jgi:hypothetical protein
MGDRATEKRGEHIRTSVGILWQILVALLFTASVAAIIGGLVYGLYRIAVFDKRIYAYLFLLVAAALFMYLVFALIKRKKIIAVLRKLAWGVLVLSISCIVLSLAVLYGSLFVRFPLAAYLSAPVIVFCLVYFLPRLKLMKKLKSFFV